jgi:hypothetical protein
MKPITHTRQTRYQKSPLTPKISPHVQPSFSYIPTTYFLLDFSFDLVFFLPLYPINLYSSRRGSLSLSTLSRVPSLLPMCIHDLHPIP